MDLGHSREDSKSLMMPNHFFRFPTQVDIVVACCIIHNWVINDGIDKFIIPEDEWTPNIQHASTSSGQAQELLYMTNFRQEIADQMWEDR